MAGRLKDKVAIVVGAGSSGPGWGNGKCTAVTFAREGAKVMCIDLKRAAAEETAGLIAKEGGVLRRAGHTESGVDLARLAGLKPAGVLCEILGASGDRGRTIRMVSGGAIAAAAAACA